MKKVINVRCFGAIGKNGIADTIGIQLALLKAKKGHTTVYIPEGTYYIYYELVIYENTTLILHDKATLIRKSPSAMLKNGHMFHKYYGYNGHGNINIIGGTFDNNGHQNNTNNTIMSIGHAKHIQIHNVTFKNVVGGHAIDCCGVDGFYVGRCNFLGFRDDSKTRMFSEAIQLDIQVEGAFPKFGAADGTITKNVLIENCYFGNSNDTNMSPWNRAIGSHASMYDRFYDNIHIRNNIFEGLGDYAITLLKSTNSIIHDNQFINCAGGIRYLAVPKGKYSVDNRKIERETQGGESLTIENNVFRGIYEKRSILIKSYDTVTNKKIYIAYNRFLDEQSNNIQLMNASNVYLLDNVNLTNIKEKNVEEIYY